MKVKVAELRKKKGWTQRQLSEQSGLSLGCIKKVERGERLPSLQTAKAIAYVLGHKIEDLIEEEEQ